MKTLKQQTRLTGILYFVLVFIAPFILLYIPSQILVDGEVTQTVTNLIDNEVLFKIGILGETLIFIIEIFIVSLLYIILKRVDKNLTVIATLARFGMVLIMAVNVIIYLSILPIINGSDLFASFTADQLDSLIYLLLNIHKYVVYVWGVFFAVHLGVLGYIITKSEFIPHLIGRGIMIGGFGYMLDSIIGFLNLDITNIFITIIVGIVLGISIVAEISFGVWLIINKKTKEYN